MRKVKRDKAFWRAAPSQARQSDVTLGRSETLLYIAEFTRTICSLLSKRRRSVHRKQSAARANRKSGLDGITDMGSHPDNIGHARWGRSPMNFQDGLHGGGAPSASDYNAGSRNPRKRRWQIAIFWLASKLRGHFSRTPRQLVLGLEHPRKSAGS
jgi:hypothetical protein